MVLGATADISKLWVFVTKWMVLINWLLLYEVSQFELHALSRIKGMYLTRYLYHCNASRCVPKFCVSIGLTLSIIAQGGRKM